MNQNITLKDLGNIYSSGGKFTKKAALLQSVYLFEKGFTSGKTTVNIYLGKEDNGKRIYKTELREYSHIVAGGTIENKNFYFNETFDYAHKRVNEKNPDETIEADRLFNNLLSSMPLAFNLFHPLMELLKKDEPKATKIIQALFPEYDIKNVDEINIEFIPLPKANYTNDKSAMDAVVFFTDRTGKTNIIAIEVKYTDTLGSNKAKDNKLKFETAVDTGYFSTEGLELISKGCKQVFRNFLLTEKYRMVHGLANSYNIILAPKDHPSTQNEIRSLTDSLNSEKCPKNKIAKHNLEDFVNTIKCNVPTELIGWIDWFQDRYLDFTKVDSLLTELKQK